MQMKSRSHILLLALGQGLYAAILCCAAFWQLQHSCGVTDILSQIESRYLLLNLMILAGVYLVLSIPWRYARTGGILFSTVCTLLAIVNHYTLQFHGSILTIQELQNAGTAMDVMGQYDFFAPAVLPEVGLQLGILAVCLGLSWAQGRLLERSAGGFGWTRRLGCLLCAAAAFALLFSGKARPYLQKARSSWQPTTTVQYHGYPMVLLSALTKYELTPPQDYDPDTVAAIPIPEGTGAGTQQPDIILILNETFYDPAQVMDIRTEEAYLGGLEGLSNALRGNAIAQSGGGTNVTEFELLTSNLQSLVGGTPFNVLNMADTASLVTVLQEQGYYTMASHPAPGSNYNRTKGYAGMGFDEIHFGSDFQNTGAYGSRAFSTDESVYANLIRWYENAQAQGKPIFSYCLTLQNHGGWDQNPQEEDIVHLKDYTGAYNEEELNEYLSCIRLSDQAFVKLCDYFRTVDRPVIVCMAGDHSPSFIDSITTRELGEETHIRQAAVPLVIWANFPLAGAGQDLGNCSVTAVGPLLLEQAGVAMPPFYRYVLELNRRFPVVTSWGQCVGSDGRLLRFDEKTPETEPIWNYLYLAHNNLLPDSLEDWFTLGSPEDDA